MTREGEQFVKNMEDLRKLAVYVGFTEESGSYDDGTTIAQIAAYNEFGTSTIPARPFMQDTVNQNQEAIVASIEQAMTMIKNWTPAKEILNRIGVSSVALMQKQIRDGQYEPNSPVTVAIKGSSHPLIDTGRMWQSIHYVIR